jgi:hypothetical protein
MKKTDATNERFAKEKVGSNASCVPREMKGYGTPLSEIKDPDMLRNMVEKLWGLLDHIDTLDDAAKDNDLFFRNTARSYQKKRFEVLSSDGYILFKPVA